MKKSGKTHVCWIVVTLWLLLFSSNAFALMIDIENISTNQETQTGISLGFGVEGSSARDFSTFFSYELEFGEVFTTPDIPEITGPGVSLLFYSLYPSGIGVSNLSLPVSDGASIEAGSNVGLDRVKLTFLVIPEPTSLLLLGSGILGLWFVRKR